MRHTHILPETSPTASLLYLPDAGFYTIESGPAALADDALACEQAHAERIVRTLGMYCLTAWQRREYSGLGPDVPTEGPSTDEPGGPGGTPPPDERLALSQPCDVCGRPAVVVSFVGRWPAYPVRVCAGCEVSHV